MWPFMYKESDWMLVYDDLQTHTHRQVSRTKQDSDPVVCICATLGHYFENKVRRRARSHCGPQDAVMVRVDQRLVQVQNQDLPLYSI